MVHLTPAIGVDLGTTYSCMGVWQRDRVEIIPNDQGNRITPCISFSDNECFIGEAAKNDAMNPTNTVFDVKRLIGRNFSDPSVQNDIKIWPFTVVSGPCGKPKIVVKYKVEERQFSAEAISSMVLAKMKEVAEVYLGRSVKNAVITVPAYFNDSQRRSTIDAGTIAGLNVMHIMDEPTAAAVAYGFHKMDDYSDRKKNVLVFDLGGGTFQVSVLSMGHDIEVKATAGDMHLGGKVFDDRMLKHFIDEFRRKYEKDIHGNLRAVQRLRTACEKAKQVLSFRSETTVQVDCLHEGIDFSTHMSKSKFEDLNKDLFNRCMDLVKNCLKDANIEKHSIDVVVLVGGSTKIPKVQNLLQEYFHGTEIFRGINSEESVACGAAVQGAKLSGHVTPLSLGFETTGSKMNTVVPRNTPIPTNKTRREFSVARHDREEMNNQAIWLLKVHEGERSEAKYNNLLDEVSIFVLATSQNFSVIIVLVSFEIDANGILSVTALNKTTGEEEKFTITNRKQRLSTDEIERMMQDAERFRANDEEFKRKYEAWNTLETCVHEMVNAINNKNAARMHSVAIQRKIKEVILRAYRLENHRPLPNAIDSELMMNELKKFRPLLGLS